MFTRWQRQHTEREHAKQVLKQDFNLISLLVMLPPIPSQEFIPSFSFRLFSMIQILNDRTCVTLRPFVVPYQVFACQNTAG